MRLQAYTPSTSIEDLKHLSSTLKDIVQLSDNEDPVILGRVYNYCISLGHLFDRTQDVCLLYSDMLNVWKRGF